MGFTKSFTAEMRRPLLPWGDHPRVLRHWDLFTETSLPWNQVRDKVTIIEPVTLLIVGSEWAERYADSPASRPGVKQAGGQSTGNRPLLTETIVPPLTD